MESCMITAMDITPCHENIPDSHSFFIILTLPLCRLRKRHLSRTSTQLTYVASNLCIACRRTVNWVIYLKRWRLRIPCVPRVRSTQMIVDVS